MTIQQKIDTALTALHGYSMAHKAFAKAVAAVAKASDNDSCLDRLGPTLLNGGALGGFLSHCDNH